jgi:hypothetical protein
VPTVRDYEIGNIRPGLCRSSCLFSSHQASSAKVILRLTTVRLLYLELIIWIPQIGCVDAESKKSKKKKKGTAEAVEEATGPETTGTETAQAEASTSEQVGAAVAGANGKETEGEEVEGDDDAEADGKVRTQQEQSPPRAWDLKCKIT